MPWSKVEEAPANIRSLNGIPLTLEQVNWIAKVADGIGSENKYNWAIAISKFKKSFKVEGDSWVKVDSETEEKEFSDVLVEKQSNGRYKIVSVSTAALEDREGETFTVKAIDYEIEESKRTGEYPEFRVFHTKPLGIGRVKSMNRVGIFAVEEGESYDDPFSLEVCEKMLSNNNGKWRTSRGFKVLEASGDCQNCGESLLLRTKHMSVGYKCPTCGTVNLGLKGSLGNTRFLRTKTFDITVTDMPAVPWTGVAAFLQNDQEAGMNKKELRKKLLNAGLSEEAVDARLSTITDETLKSFDDIPEAEVLKEFDDLEETASSEQTFTLDEAVLKEFDRISKRNIGAIIEKTIREVFDGAILEAEGGSGDVVTKEYTDLLAEVQEQLKELSEKVDTLLENEEDRLKELVAAAPRGSSLRISRFKSAAGVPGKKKRMPQTLPEEDMEDVEEMEDGEEDDMENVPLKKKKKEFSDGVIGADGTQFSSMTEFVRGGSRK